MANNNIVSEFVRNNLQYGHNGGRNPDAIPRMHRMLYIDRTTTDINVKDSTFYGWTVLHYQAQYGTTGSVTWLLRQDPPPISTYELPIRRHPL